MDVLLNRNRAIEVMTRDNLDALVATLPENVVYASNYGGHGAYDYRGLQLYVVLLRDDINDATLILPISEVTSLACHPTWIGDVRTYGTFYTYGKPEEARLTGAVKDIYSMRNSLPNFSRSHEALVSTLADKHVSEARIGVDEMNLTPAMWESLRRAIPKAELIPAFSTFREIRMIKTPAEIALIRQAFAVTEQALRDAISAIGEGVTEFEVYQTFRESVISQGALFGFWTSGAGPHSAIPGITPSTDLRLKRGDLYRFDCGSIWAHAWSDTGRTAVVGEPSPRQKRIYNALLTAVEAGLSITKPGTKVSDLFNTIVAVVREQAVPEYQRHHTGHSIGLEFYEPPLVAPPSNTNVFLPGVGDIALERGMVLNLEAPYYEPGFGGLQIENTVLITEDGWEPITTNSNEMFRR